MTFERLLTAVDANARRLAERGSSELFLQRRNWEWSSLSLFLGNQFGFIKL